MVRVNTYVVIPGTFYEGSGDLETVLRFHIYVLLTKAKVPLNTFSAIYSCVRFSEFQPKSFKGVLAEKSKK